MPLHLSIKEQQDAGLPPENGTRRQQPAGWRWGINTLQCLRRAPASGRVCKCCVGSKDFAEKAAKAPILPDLAPQRESPARLCHGPGAGGHRHLCRGTGTGVEKHRVPTARKRRGGWFLRAAQPCHGAQRSRPQSLPHGWVPVPGGEQRHRAGPALGLGTPACLLPLGRRIARAAPPKAGGKDTSSSSQVAS